MHLLANVVLATALLAGVARPAIVPSPQSAVTLDKRQSDETVVDLGYSIYKGVSNDTLKQTWWKG